MGLGTLAILSVFLFPLVGDNVIGEYRKHTESVIIEVTKAPSETPSAEEAVPPQEIIQVRQYSISVTNSGGQRELDACTGGFTEMLDQEDLDEKTLLSAHNNCRGDVILPIVVGDRVVIENRGVFEVIDSRDTRKKATSDEISDMNGEILLQTCYYREDRMKFLALTPISDSLVS